MPIWMQWFMALWFVYAGLAGLLHEMRKGDRSAGSVAASLSVYGGLLVFGTVAIVYLIGGAK